LKGLWLEDGQLQLREDLALPIPPEGEVLIRVLSAGICSTDIGLLRGMYPFAGIPGHEFVGTVEEGPEDLRGQRVVAEINAVCGNCARCRRGTPRHCARRTVLGIQDRDGAFAEYLSVPAANLHRVPDSLSTAAATFTEPLAAALEILEQIAVGPEDRVLLVGDGKLGQLIAQVLARTGCALHAVGRHPRKLDLLRERAIECISAEETAGADFDIAIECTGSTEGFGIARGALRPCGTLVLKSTYPGALELDATSIVVDEISVLGSRCGPFAPALRLLEEGAIAVESLIDATYGLDDGVQAFDHAQRKGVLKVLLSKEEAG